VWQEVRTELHPQGLEIVTVALDVEGADVARQFIEAAQPQHPSLIDQAHVLDQLFGVVNVPNSVWIDETGTLVRPAEPAHPPRSPIMEQLGSIDLSTLPPDLADVLGEAKKIRSESEPYMHALRDWVARGAESPYALAPDEVVARSHPRPLEVAAAAAHFELGQHLHRAGSIEAAQAHFREAHRGQPDNWTYKRQAWNFVSPVVQGPTEVYDSCWIDDVKKVGAENYYPALEMEPRRSR
jgi:hypothetical protein